MFTIEQEKLLNNIHSKVFEYLNSEQIKPNKTSEEIKLDLDISVGNSSDFSQIKILVDKYLDNSVKTNSPKFYNQLYSGFSFTAYIGELISTITNNSMYTFEMSPVATLIEIELLKKMSELVGYKNGDGTFVPGGSNGNFLAMLAARQYCMPETMSSGLFGSSPMTVFVSKDCHYSMIKSANQLGIGTNNIVKVDVDSSGRMDPKALERSIQVSVRNGSKPFFVGATAGTTVRGCFDPIKEISRVCKKYNIWLHIDASWGGAALLSNQHKKLLDGSSYSDSFTWCPHKAMAQPLTCTAILFKNPKILFEINDVEGTEYLFHKENDKQPDLGKRSLQCGRRVEALKLWLTWKYYGDSGYEKNIDHLFDMARYAENKVNQSKILKQISDVSYLNICFQIQPDGISNSHVGRFTVAVRDELFQNADAMVNYAEIESQTCMRLITVNYDLKREHLDQLFSDIESTAERILPRFELTSKQKKSVYFLFINGPHHVYHLIEPALSFASKQKNYESMFVSGNPINTNIIKTSHRLNISADFTLLDIPMPLRYRLNKSYKGKIYPPVFTRFDKIASQLKNASAVVSTSHELPRYIKKNKITGPKLFYLYHGTGTRSYGFDPYLDEFDYILVPGVYHKDRLIKEKVCDKNKIIMIGQPKFDWFKKHHFSNENTFKNGNPIFYYNPHWEMDLSSYLTWRNVILDFFRKHSEYNLIFAPHPLVKHLSKKNKYSLETQKNLPDNIIIDLNSSKLIDGTYNQISDVYIGDVSSMVTEWINYRPRPCIFINAHKIKWEEDESYAMWKYGTVIDNPINFDKTIYKSLENNYYYENQLKHKEKFIHKADKSASDLCADYIFEKL